MRKLLRPKDYLLLSLALTGDILDHTVGRGSAARRFGDITLLISDDYKAENYLKVVSRMLATEEIERIVKKDGKPYLRLTSFGQKSLSRDFALDRLGKRWDGRWVVVIFDIPEQDRWVRDKLRPDLYSLGFRMLQESVWISPFPIAEDIREYLINSGLAGQALVMVGPWMLAGGEKNIARKVFKIDQINGEYQLMLEVYKEEKDREKAAKDFLSSYLDTLVRDPFLPEALLPDDWVGKRAQKLFQELSKNYLF